MEGSREPPRKRQRIEGPKVTVPGRGSQPQRQLPREAYTIGWICPLHVELSAALAMLDEEHVVPKQDVGDANTYMVGKIHQHSVVIACLPHLGYGTNNAATVANNMRRSFPSIRLQLVVGIGGGVPGKADVRLGDVVVGQKVLQHDIGKLKDGILQVMGAPVEAPPEAMSAITMMQASHRRHSRSMLTALSEVAGQNPNITSDADKSQLQDWLYESSYEHVESGRTCDVCDSSRRIIRPLRIGNNPVIHYGTIASGNQVLKHAQTRDRLCQTHDVLCVEMEAAGLIRNSSSLVIRGICDYADSHKNKEWQPYAAVVAAAYAREFLYFLPAREARTQPEIGHLQRDMPRCSETLEPLLQYPGRNTTLTEESQATEEITQALVNSLKYDELGNRHANIQKAHGITCKWLLHKQEYRDWLDPSEFSNHHGLLWIKGKPGAGKSTLMKFTLSELKKKTDNSIIISFFFNARGNDIEKSTPGMYRALLFQLLTLVPSLRHIFRSLDVTVQSRHHIQWGVETLKELFQQVVQSLGDAPLLCLVDALDECDEAGIRDMVSFFQELGRLALSTGVHFHVCFASRHYPHITVGTGIHLTLEGQEGHSQDISNYIETNLHIGNSRPANMLRSNLLEKASGVFMWVVLVVKMLNEDHDSGLSSARLRRKLQDIPGDLHALFHNLLIRDNKMTEEMQLCFQWVLFARQPLSAKELYVAIHSGLDTVASGDADERFGWQSSEMSLDLVERFLLSASKGLVEVTKSQPQITQFIHESVKDFLLKENKLRVVWPNIGEGFEGRSHDRLKQCCLDYILVAHRHIPTQLFNRVRRTPLFGYQLEDTKNENESFLRYATTNLLHHADHAQGLGNSQHDFISRFPLQKWKDIRIATGLYHDEAHDPMTSSLLYILAEYNSANLIRIYPAKGCFLNVEKQKYGTPLFAALALTNHETVQVFLQIGTNDLDDSSGDNKHKEVLYERDGVPGHTRSFTFNPSRTILSQLAELGNDALLSMALCQRSVTIDLGPCQKTGLTLLHQAAARGFVASLALLIQEGASIDQPSQHLSGMTAIQLAARHGHDESVRLLLDKGASVGGRSLWEGRDTLSWAVEGGLKIVQLLLERGAKVNTVDNRRRTSLIHAVSYNADPSIISLLLEKGALTDIADYEGETALHRAIDANGLEATRLLLNKGASIEIADRRGRTPLFVAIENQRIEIARLLITKGASIHVTDEDQSTMLVTAVRANNKLLVCLLIENGASINASNKNVMTSHDTTWSQDTSQAVFSLQQAAAVDSEWDYGDTALMPAVMENNIPFIYPLIKEGVYPDDSSREPLPLHEAVEARHETMVQLLLEKGAAVDNADIDGHTPLIRAIRTRYLQIVKILVSAGAHVNFTDRRGITPLHEAAGIGYEAIVEVLLKGGAIVDVADKDGRTPLIIAIHGQREKMVDLLLAAGAPVNVATKPWDTWSSQSSDSAASLDRGVATPPTHMFTLVPLFEAIRFNNVTIVELLLRAGALVDLTDDDGSTPLHQAVQQCKIDVIQLLLKWRASTSIVDGDGRTPLRLAVHNLSNTSNPSKKDKLEAIITLLSAVNDPGVVDAP